MSALTEFFDGSPQQLRRELQEGETEHVKLRRGIIGLSLIGMGAMGRGLFVADWDCEASA